MIDLAFLAIAIYVIVKANNGEYKETACNIAMVVGIIAGLVGCIFGISSKQGVFVVLNMVVMCGAFGIRFAAKKLVSLYLEKMVADAERWENERRMRARFSDPDRKPVYTDETFDDEELRFGKGGYTEHYNVCPEKKVSLEKKKVSLEKREIYTDKDFDDEELRFGKGGYTDNKL